MHQMSWDLALHTVISFLTTPTNSIILVKLNYLFVANDRYCRFASHHTNDGVGFGGCDLKSFLLSAPKSYCVDVAEQPDQILIGNYWADVIRPTDSLFASTLFCLVFIA
jgi:K+-transporting ATPase ATPase A chain